MYNLMLVDDEHIVLNGIQTVFKLEDFGFNVVGAYTNPQKALEDLAVTRPDLIITDIKMPQMNGLEFSRKAREFNPDVEIVILSGYGDFEFAQTAIGIGVTDYLLKPIKKQVFEEMLIKVEKRICAKYASNAEYKLLSQTIMNNLPLIKNRFFLDLVNGSKDDKYYEHQYHSLGLLFLPHQYVLIKFIIRASVPDDLRDSLMSHATKSFPEYLKNCGYTEIFYTDEYLCFLLYELNCNLVKVKAELSKAVKQFHSDKDIECAVSLSNLHIGFREFIIANMECDTALLQSFQNKESIFATNSIESEFKGLALPGTKLENLSIAISLHEELKAIEIIKDLFDNSPDIVAGADYYYSIAIIILLKLFDMQKGLNFSLGVITINEISIQYLKSSYKSAWSLQEFLTSKLKLLIAGSQNKSDARLSKITSNAIDYINKHYSENISLSDIADHVYVSKNYLCHIFKKEMNSTLLSYLMDIRIKKAKALLENGKHKVHEVAKLTGFSDDAYFSQIFKKHTGLTPSEYRNDL